MNENRESGAPEGLDGLSVPDSGFWPDIGLDFGSCKLLLLLYLLINNPIYPYNPIYIGYRAVRNVGKLILEIITIFLATKNHVD